MVWTVRLLALQHGFLHLIQLFRPAFDEDAPLGRRESLQLRRAHKKIVVVRDCWPSHQHATNDVVLLGWKIANDGYDLVQVRFRTRCGFLRL